jgi:hypothetical protein
LPIIIGGRMIDAQACRFTEADFWTTDALEGEQWCRQIVEGKI